MDNNPNEFNEVAIDETSKKLTTCKACGVTMAKNAKACPKCGAKNKKPIFKKWWFWAIIIIIILAIAGSSGSSDTTPPTDAVMPNGASDEQKPEEQKNNDESDPQDQQTIGQKNALKAAKNYIKMMAFSHSGLVKQLEFEQYANVDAVYAADNCGADWNEQAAKSAKNYLTTMAFSRDSLITQLEFDGYTNEQAVYGAEANGY